jgi:excisionase family DNA binding protein
VPVTDIKIIPEHHPQQPVTPNPNGDYMAEISPAIAALAAQLIQQIATTLQNEQAQRPSPGRLEPRLLTAEQAGDYIGRSEQAVRHLIFQRDIPAVRKGRCVRIDRKDLDRWIENNKC